MGSLHEFVTDLMPRRRRRMWRYVSPQRHGMGVVGLGLLVCAVGAYWMLTNDSRVRSQARQYLSEMTGGTAEVRKAKFRLFGGIELRGVSLYIPGDDIPFFQTDKIVLQHRPLGLFLHGRLDVISITFDSPVVNLIRDAQAGTWNYQRLFGLTRQGQASSQPSFQGNLPPLTARNVKVQTFEQIAGIRVRKDPTVLNLSGNPRGPALYGISVEQPGTGVKPAAFGSVELNLATGGVVGSGNLEMGMLDDSLLQQFGRLRDQYKVRGHLSVEGRWDPGRGKGTLEARLADASMQLPPELGGLKMHSVGGSILMDGNGVTLKDVAGRVVQAGDARFRLSGRYEGYDASSAMEMSLALEGLAVPERLDDASEDLSRILANIHKDYMMKGKMNVEVNLSRPAGGPFRVSGSADPNGLTVQNQVFPYSMTVTGGQVAFSDERVEFRQLTGRHGKARIQIDGGVRFAGGRTYETFIKAEDFPFDKDLEDALPADYVGFYSSIKPQGKTDANVHIWVAKPGDPEHVQVDLTFGGHASIEYHGFPYRVENVFGQVHFNANEAILDSLTSQHDQTNCTIGGRVRWDRAGRQEVDITVDAHAPADEKLARALGPDGQAAFQTLRPTGMVERAHVHVTQEFDKPMTYLADVHIQDASINIRDFPYAVTGAAGQLIVEPGVISLKSITGRHGRTPITANGKAYYGGKNLGLDLSIFAQDMQADQDLLAALPPEAKRIWQRISPSGLADANFTLRSRTPEAPNVLDYCCQLDLKDAKVQYADFPYPFANITGRAIITPGGVELKNVTSTDGAMKATVDGRITGDDKEDRAELAVRAYHVPLSAQLLAALPGKAMPLFQRFRPGGQCSMELSKLVLVLPNSPAAPATAPAGKAAATAPAAPQPQWLVEGAIAVCDADIDLGMGRRKISGHFEGVAAKDANGVQTDANFIFDSLTFNDRVMTDVQGRLIKRTSDEVFKIDELFGKAYGGRVAGFVEIRAGEPMQYAVRLFAEHMNLKEVFNAGVTDPNKKSDIEGLLDAEIELRSTEGPKASRQGAGLLHISQAKLLKLPVLLDLSQPIFLSLPGEAPFNEGAVVYTFKDDKLNFREIHLRGSGMSIVGSGTMNLKTEAIQLTFLGRPGILPRLDSLADELFEGILREFMEIRVTGTLMKPRYRTIPLRSFDAILQRLFRPTEEP